MIDRKLKKLSAQIKNEAIKIGFSACGISKAQALTDEKDALEGYLSSGFHGEMKFLEANFEKRLDPGLILDGAKSVISVILNHYTKEKQKDDKAPVVSKYAYGKDYHLVMKDKLNSLLSFIKSRNQNINGKVFVDSAPVLEKAWARNACLGWIGKNSLLINKDIGSFVFIGEVIVDIELDYDFHPAVNYCGLCTRCIDACPTKAIEAPGIVNGSKCISYLTVERKDGVPDSFKNSIQNRIFGCDLCQDVCPFNKKIAKPNRVAEFKPIPQILNFTKEDWYTMDKELFTSLFKNSPLSRVKYEGFKRNLEFLKKSG